MTKKLTPVSSAKSEKPKPPGREYDSVRMSSSLGPEVFWKSYFWRKKNKICAVVFLFLTVSIIFIKFANSSNLQKIKRIKRHSHFHQHQNDIEIIPENRKHHHHPNHRYEEEETEKHQKATHRLNSRRGWPAQERLRHPDSIQDVILKGKPKGPRAEGQFQSDLLKGSGSTMRLRGVYVHPGSEGGLFGGQWDDTFYDSKEINNLMRNDSGAVGGRPAKGRFKSPGAPFKLPGAEGPGRWTPKTRPITIYLDFHPMNHFGEIRRGKPVATPFNKFRAPLPIHPVNVGEFLPAQRSPNGIIMKLNLYPKEPAVPEWHSDRQTSHSKHNKRAEKKSFGWFSKKKEKKEEEEEEEGGKDRPKKCSILGLNPRGKRITAKWKNEKGEWIHAEHVDIKILKKD